MKYDKAKETDACPICLIEHRNKKVIMTECSHEFCDDCILEWYDKSRTCPVSRANLHKSQKIEYYGFFVR